MLWLRTHGIAVFVATGVFFVALAIAAWVAVGYGGAIIVGVLALIWLVFALPPLVMYFDDANNPESHRFPDALG